MASSNPIAGPPPPPTGGPSPADRALRNALAHEYVRDLWLLITAVIGLLTLINFTAKLLTLLSKRKPSSPINEKEHGEAVTPGRAGKTSLRRLPAALASGFRIVAFRTVIPVGPSSVVTITESTFIVVYIVANLVWLFVRTKDLKATFFQDRAAHLASSQLPLVVALAGKNNILTFLTGISHEKLNVLHRAAARTCLLLLWIHAMTRYASGLPAIFSLSHGWMRWGVTGLTAFTLATLLSIRPIRHAAFEFFLVSHIILIGIFLVGGYLHAKSPHWGVYIWPALLVWGLDRFLRFSRVIWYNRVWRGVKNNVQSNASVELLTPDTVRLTLRRNMSWKAGQHAYVVLPSVSNMPTEAHPFTIASIPQSLDGTEPKGERDVVFIIRGRTGFTKLLQEHAMTEPTEPVAAYIDGPYGCPPDLTVFSTCVLIAGGSGVSYTLPLLLDLVQAARAGKSSVKRVVFVWMVRQPEHLTWISKLLTTALVACPSSLTINTQIHVTGAKGALPDVNSLGQNDTDSVSGTPSVSDEEKKPELPLSIKTNQGRPDIHQILEEATCSASGPVSVDVAGPSPLAQSVRSSLSSNLTSPSAVLKGRQPVTLHVETFGMVTG